MTLLLLLIWNNFFFTWCDPKKIVGDPKRDTRSPIPKLKIAGLEDRRGTRTAQQVANRTNYLHRDDEDDRMEIILPLWPPQYDTSDKPQTRWHLHNIPACRLRCNKGYRVVIGGHAKWILAKYHTFCYAADSIKL
jgi:hypothetical protein